MCDTTRKRVRMETFPRACLWYEVQALKKEMSMGHWRIRSQRSTGGITLVVFEREAKK